MELQYQLKQTVNLTYTTVLVQTGVVPSLHPAHQPRMLWNRKQKHLNKQHPCGASKSKRRFVSFTILCESSQNELHFVRARALICESGTNRTRVDRSQRRGERRREERTAGPSLRPSLLSFSRFSFSLSNLEALMHLKFVVSGEILWIKFE